MIGERTNDQSIQCVCVFFFFDCFGFERQNVAPVDAPTFSVGHASNDEAVLPENVDDLVCFKVHVLCFVCVCVCVCFFFVNNCCSSRLKTDQRHAKGRAAANFANAGVLRVQSQRRRQSVH